MPRKLDVFDFDGTLFRSPEDTEQNRKKYLLATGIPWVIDKEASRELSKRLGQFVPMRRGWWGKGETLEPPLVPNPAPPEWFITSSVEALHKSKADPDTLTLIMTGRHAGIKGKVLRILDDGKLVKIEKKASKNKDVFYEQADPDVTCIFMGENGPKPKGTKPGETLPWKVWILEQYMELYPEIETVEFWEDRDEHVESFKELHGLLAKEVKVNHVVDS